MSKIRNSKFEIRNILRYHLVGICGMGMTALALILKNMGNQVDGSDAGTEYPTTSTLKKYQIPVLGTFNSSHIAKIDTVIYSGANGGATNVEVVSAQKQGIATISLAKYIGELSAQKETISVCGCHGKSTTTALLAYVGEQLGLPISYYVGAPSFMGLPPGDWKIGDYFVVESDEYVADPIADRTPKFYYLHPTVILCTNIDFDHPDVFKDVNDVEKTFKKFFEQIPPNGYLIINGDDDRLLNLARQSKKTFYSYGCNTHNDFLIRKVEELGELLSFTVTHRGKILGTFSTKLLGLHNAYNATAAVAFYTLKGYSPAQINKALMQFTGVSRRIEFFEKIKDILLYDDYAHHPTEIAATLTAFKKRFPSHHLTVIFQPHTFSRTEKFKNEFIDSLQKADTTIVLPIFASARETTSEFTVTSNSLVLKAQQKGLVNFKNTNSDSELLQFIAELAKKFPRHIFITMGAGDVYTKLPLIKKVLL